MQKRQTGQTDHAQVHAWRACGHVRRKRSVGERPSRLCGERKSISNFKRSSLRGLDWGAGVVPEERGQAPTQIGAQGSWKPQEQAGPSWGTGVWVSLGE